MGAVTVCRRRLPISHSDEPMGVGTMYWPQPHDENTLRVALVARTRIRQQRAVSEWPWLGTNCTGCTLNASRAGRAARVTSKDQTGKYIAYKKYIAGQRLLVRPVVRTGPYAIWTCSK
jgi:hypothetical protein